MPIKHRVLIFPSSILMRLILFFFDSSVSFKPFTFILKYYKDIFNRDHIQNQWKFAWNFPFKCKEIFVKGNQICLFSVLIQNCLTISQFWHFYFIFRITREKLDTSILGWNLSNPEKFKNDVFCPQPRNIR